MDDFAPVDWHGFTLAVMLLGTLVAIPLSFLVLAFYRRAVERAMRRVAGPPHERRTGEGLSAAERVEPVAHSDLRLEVLDHRTPLELSPGAASLFERAHTAPRTAVPPYAAAALVHAAILTVAYMGLVGFEFFPRRTLYLSLIFLWPLVPTLALIAVASRRLKIAVPIAYFFVLLLVSGQEAPGVLTIFLWFMGVPTLFMLAVSNRRLRTAGPLVLVGTVIFAGALNLLPWTQMWTLLHLEALGVTGVRITELLVLLAAGALTWLLVAWIASRYRGKRLSDQMVVVGLWWLLFTIWICLLLAGDVGIYGLMGLLAFVGFAVVQRLALRPLHREAQQRQNVRLLLLRAFGFRRRSERLLEELGLYWRYVGSIQMIAGTDLATANLEPHKFLDYMSGRLNRQFIGDTDDLEHRIRTLDLHPDPDGRYRVNEFFCRENTWRQALNRLASQSDAVLMDLRGFTRQNEGCVYELRQLVSLRPARSLVFAVDDDTDMDFLRQTLEHAWHTMDPRSANALPPEPALRLLHVKRQDAREVQQLLALLCAAAQPDTESALVAA